jgi:hypothetical protein
MISDKKQTKPLVKTTVSGSAYLAFMRIDYEGIYESSMKLFSNKKDAEKYLQELKEKHGTWSQTYEVVELHCH